jgi:NAD(P)H-hydrate epimerase
MMLTAVTSPPLLPHRPNDGHKGTFGTVVVVGGCPTMIGAPALVAAAAFRTGCGLVKIITDPAIVPHCLTIEPCATALDVPMEPGAIRRIIEGLGNRPVLVVGPGMGIDGQRDAIILALLQTGRPIVLDADGLNHLASLGPLVKTIPQPAVLTPHPGEFHRLAQAAGITLDPVDPQHRPVAAAALARRYGCTVLLKGRHSIISDGQRFFRNETGSSALATGGSGDVLAGIIGSLMAQGMAPFDAACAGAHLHGLAGDVWCSRHGSAGLTAMDLARVVPDAMSQMPREAGAAGGGAA